MALVGETRRRSDVAQIHAPFRHELLRPLQLKIQYKLMWRFSGRPLETPRELVLAQTRDAGKRFYTEILLEVRFDVFNYFPHQRGIQAVRPFEAGRLVARLYYAGGLKQTQAMNIVGGWHPGVMAQFP
ncbi:hypothetical protein AW736_16980 [Termitidicoccus mucosus]|uniref:Uncharacterized protein n=1 Tax=Termitidicoccus mucosus TaxID=1184151 RepID=A0A178IH94_9BACT|nr:hypothetical protein AW736_16980 [Opitutaceae bacterium TSB47]